LLVRSPRAHLPRNLEAVVWHLRQGVERFIQERAVNDYLKKIDADLGTRVASGLCLGVP
jgi:catalase